MFPLHTQIFLWVSGLVFQVLDLGSPPCLTYIDKSSVELWIVRFFTLVISANVFFSERILFHFVLDVCVYFLPVLDAVSYVLHFSEFFGVEVGETVFAPDILSFTSSLLMIIRDTVYRRLVSWFYHMLFKRAESFVEIGYFGQACLHVGLLTATVRLNGCVHNFRH